MYNAVTIFTSPYELAEKFAWELINMIIKSAKKKKSLSVALSGGETPELLFSMLGDHYPINVPWEYIHFFWVDERCVPPGNPESNFGMTSRKLLGKIDIPSSNIHRIRGEESPAKEVSRYSEEISDFTGKRDGLPLFDLILLGMGEDGHTASIFPGHIGLFSSDKICEVVAHPVTLQKRITLTGRVINNADSVTFLVTGKKKAGIVEKIINKGAESHNFPASYVVPGYGVIRWLIDEDAGSLL